MRTQLIAVLLIITTAMSGQWRAELEALLQHPDIVNAQVSISVRSAEGEIIVDQDADVLLIPASTIKTITTMSSIGIMGAEYRYTTDVGYTGELADDGTLYGDLIVIGSGDPSLGSGEDEQVQDMHQTIEEILSAIRGLGITCVNGYILLDDTVFDQEAVHPGWPWDDLCNYYAAGTYGINLNENRYKVTFERSEKAHLPTSINSIAPLYPLLTMDNQVTTGELGSYDNAYIYGDPYGVKRSVRGTIPPGKGTFEIEGAVPDGTFYMGHHIARALDGAGIGIKGYLKTESDTILGIKPILSLGSPTIMDLARYANRESDNLYCDAFLKTVGANTSGVGSWSTGQEAIEAYLVSLDVDIRGWRQVDGSGLSARNRISPAFMTAFLKSQYDRIGITSMKYLLPKAGKEGTVKNFLKGMKVQEHAWLKSGSISSVVAYAGVLDIYPAQHAFISIVSNGHQAGNSTVRKQLELIIDKVYEGCLEEMNK